MMSGKIVSFNPTVVRLGPCSCGHYITFSPPFNPTVVRLGRAMSRRLGPGRPDLSIPLWCDWD